jgi:hypothetical protein
MATPKFIEKRPAESATPVAMAVAMLLGKAASLSTDTIAYLAIVVSFTPAAITWLVALKRGQGA